LAFFAVTTTELTVVDATSAPLSAAIGTEGVWGEFCSASPAEIGVVCAWTVGAARTAAAPVASHAKRFAVERTEGARRVVADIVKYVIALIPKRRPQRRRTNIYHIA
jgi:hypothetical protein